MIAKAMVRIVQSVALASLGIVSLGLGACQSAANRSAKAPVASTENAQGTIGASVGDGALGRLPEASARAHDPIMSSGLSVSGTIAQACAITPKAAVSTPSFDFDSAALGPDDRSMLAEVAKCLAEGALSGKSVVLIGRADARGEPEYNMTLGGSRADAVHRYLVDLGVGKDRMRATSRGELDAVGHDEQGFALDRRVDIELAL